MASTILLAIIIMVIAYFMTMTGRGGGNFYMLALVFSGLNMTTSASTAQFILMCSSLVAAILFSKQKVNHWQLTFILGGLIFISALAGGYLGKYFDEKLLKVVFAVVMFLAACFMLKKPKKEKIQKEKYWILNLKSKEQTIQVNLIVTIPIVLLTGFLSGMVGVSGGSFLVPLMLLTMAVPMHTAVSTSTMLVMISASAGFFGHLGAGVFDYQLAVPLAIGGMIGGYFGAKMALKSKPKKLKYLFAGTQMLASIIMLISLFR